MPSDGLVRCRRLDGIRSLQMGDGSWLLFDESKNVVHAVNETAGFVWARCDGFRTALNICEDMQRSYEVAEDTAARDVGRILQELTRLGLLTTNGE